MPPPLRAFKHELARARRHGYPLTGLLLDVDNFKRINDNYGSSLLGWASAASAR